MFFSSARFKAFILMYQESMLVHRFIVNIILSPDAGPTTHQLCDFEQVIQSHEPHFSLICKRKKIISNTRWLLRSKKATMVKLLCVCQKQKHLNAPCPSPCLFGHTKEFIPNIWILNNPLPSRPMKMHDRCLYLLMP